MSSSSHETGYFDLHITGLGYLNRIREVAPKKGDSFLACDIVALNGPSDKAEYRRFDVRVSGNKAQQLVRRCIQAVNDKRKVLIGFRLGDLWTDTFVYEKGQNAGKHGVSLKARLLFVSWIKVDGKQVYKAEPTNTAPGAVERERGAQSNTGPSVPETTDLEGCAQGDESMPASGETDSTEGGLSDTETCASDAAVLDDHVPIDANATLPVALQAG
jgi:hypothetical protein